MERCTWCRKEIGGGVTMEMFIPGAIAFCCKRCAVEWSLALPLTDPTWNEIPVSRITSARGVCGDRIADGLADSFVVARRP